MHAKHKVVIVEKNGTDVTHATIVLARKPAKAARLAAAELQYHIELVTGIKLPVEQESAKISGSRILVGSGIETQKLGLSGDDMESQEYLISFFPDTVVIMGRDKEDYGEMDYETGNGLPDFFDEQGTLYATYDFLERYCGVRWYFPTDLGIVFTTSERIVAGGNNLRRSPAMKYRFVDIAYRFPLDLTGDTVPAESPVPVLPVREHHLFYLRNRIGGSVYAVNHSFNGWYERFWNPDNPQKHHPGLFAQGYPTGERPPQLCYTNPDVVARTARDARDYFDGKGLQSGSVAAGDYFALVPMDNDQWCKCEGCQKWLLGEATLGKGNFSNNSASDYLFQFVNSVAREVKKTHPGKFIATLGYWNYCYPPENVKLESNVNVQLCLHTRSWGHSPEVRENDIRILQKWSERKDVSEISLWLYYCFPSIMAAWGGYRMFPGFFAPDIAEYMKIFHGAGVKGIKYEPSYISGDVNSKTLSMQSPLLDQLEFYLTWKLADNPQIDGNELIEEFFIRYYGPAAQPMRNFYMKSAEIFGNPANRPSGVSDPVLSWKYLGTPERMEQLGRFIDEAGRAVAEKGTEKENERVALFNRGVWQYMQKGYNTYREQARIPFPALNVPRISPPAEGNMLLLDWQNGGIMEGWFSTDGSMSNKNVEGVMLHDGKNLYLRLIDTMDTANLADRNGSIWQSDNYQIFMAGQRNKPYLQIGIHFDGRFIALMHPGGELDFTGRAISDISHRNQWAVYLAMPLKETGIKAGDIIYMNVIRSMSVIPCSAVMWNPTFGPYHAPERFVRVTLLK